MISDALHIRRLRPQAYSDCMLAMKQFTIQRDDTTIDEIWLTEHPPVFTQGQNGKAEHVLHPGDIPVIQTDRGGQVTYHGPGQLMLYTLINLQRRKMNIREFVCCLEKTIISYLDTCNIKSYGKRDAPGVYILGKDNVERKICSIGLRVKRACTYHGLAFNIDMDLEPFKRINPCGFQGLQVTQLKDCLKHCHPSESWDPGSQTTCEQKALGPSFRWDDSRFRWDDNTNIGMTIANHLSQQLGYTTQQFSED